jgi:4-hydroxy-3-polyprenylbenzoate decarboxylase
VLTPSYPSRLIVGITGATGIVYGMRLLQVLKDEGIETHLVMSKWAGRTLVEETDYQPSDLTALATRVYAEMDQGAAISSGSFLTSGMVIVPCSMRTLAAIATGQADNLVARAADVILKERRRLVLVTRESPLNDIHLENMLKLSRMGATICPPMPAFYNKPRTIDDIVNYTDARVLDQFGIHIDVKGRWEGLKAARAAAAAVAPREDE